MANYFQTGGPRPAAPGAAQYTGGMANSSSGVVKLGGGGGLSPYQSAYFQSLQRRKADEQEQQPVLIADATANSTPPPDAPPPADPPASQPPPAPPPSQPPVQPPPTQPPPTRPPTPPTPPPPPSRPAQTGPDSGGMANQLWTYAMGAMNNPSRYDADLVKQGAQVIEDTIARMRTAGTRSIGEWSAGRGLIGSSLEGERMTDLNSELDAHAQERLFNLQREQANTFATDRSSAYGLGLGAGGLGEQVSGRLGLEDYRNRSLDQQRYFGDQDVDYRNRSLDQDRWRTEGGWDRQDRGLDQNQMALYADLADRYGPDVLEQLGITQPGGQTPGQRPDPNDYWSGTPPRTNPPARSYFNSANALNY